MNKKLVNISILIFLISLFISSLAYADNIMLKNGNLIEGEIIEETDEYIKIDIKNQGTTKIAVDLVRAKTEKEEVPPAYALAEYGSLKEKAYLSDPEERIKLGNFCLENGLLDEAKVQLKRAAEIEPQYRNKVNELILEINKAQAETLLSISSVLIIQGYYDEALDYLNKLTERFPDTKIAEETKEKKKWLKKEESFLSKEEPLTADKIKQAFSVERAPVPYFREDAQKIIAFLRSIKGDKNALYSNLCLKKAEEFVNETKEAGLPEQRIYLLTLARRLTHIADAGSVEDNPEIQVMRDDILSKLNNLTAETFVIPKYLDIEMIIGFFKEAEPALRKALIRSYTVEAQRLEDGLKQTTNQKKKIMLQKLTSCYHIIYFYYSEYAAGPEENLYALLFKHTLGKLKNTE